MGFGFKERISNVGLKSAKGSSEVSPSGIKPLCVYVCCVCVHVCVHCMEG